ncbi:MAG: hypothetical protein IJP72_01045 [Bacteroidales bacterium]|nr:hypothetical protein [Bacteroidales bacterium]
MSYEINFREMVRRLLPSALRGESTAAFFSVLAHPFQELHTAFEDYIVGEHGKRWYLSHNWTADSMQAMLNEYFEDLLVNEGFDPYPEDPTEIPIKVEDGVEGNEVLVYPAAIQIFQLTPIRLTAGSTWGERPFVVLIPNALEGIIDEDRVRGLVNIFKLYGIGFRIVYYQI